MEKIAESDRGPPQTSSVVIQAVYPSVEAQKEDSDDRNVTTKHSSSNDEETNPPQKIEEKLDQQLPDGHKLTFAQQVSRKPCTHFKSWADGSSSSDDEVDRDLDVFKASRQTSEITLPGDIEEIWPKGYNTLLEVANRHSFSVKKSSLVTMRNCGFKDTSFFDSKKKESHFSTLNDAEKTSLATLLNVVYFTKLRPTEGAIKEPKFALSANFALHFILLESVNDKELLKKSLKHSDGGSLIVRERCRSRFLLGTEAADLIVLACERLYRSNAKSLLQKGLSESDILEIQESCFTTPEGLLQAFMRTETRKETRYVDDITSKGKAKKVKKEVLVRGVLVPNLPVGSEYLLPSEREQMRRNEFDWKNRVGIMNDVATRYKINKPIQLTLIAQKIVETSYSLLQPIKDVEKRRKNKIRLLALEKRAGEKITQSEWQAAAEQVLACEHAVYFDDVDAERLTRDVIVALGKIPEFLESRLAKLDLEIEAQRGDLAVHYPG